MQKLAFGVLFLLLNTVGFTQAKKWNPYAKKRMYFFWGWNRAAYTNSDLHLKGADYDLLIKNMVAHDRQTPFNAKTYFNPVEMTIPQNNWRIGYFIKDNLAITFGTDHMKYVMDQNQIALVQGSITRDGVYKGNYNQPVVLTEDFLTFEHTDGLNYVNAEVEKFVPISSSKSGSWAITAIGGGGIGFMYPKTNAKLLNYERNDRFHFSGFGLSGKLGIELLMLKRLALRFEGKTGYIDMPNIILHKQGIPGKGSQHFYFAQCNGSLVLNFGTHKL